jgi:uncharacterized protein YxjI
VLDRNLILVKEKSKLFSSRKSYEILDESGAAIGTAEQSTGALAKILSAALGDTPTQIDFKDASGNPVMTIRRKGYLFKKVIAEDGNGEVLGRYKAKMFSLAGGFHVYSLDGKHLAEIRGKLLKSEYTIFGPDGKTELGKVSKKWGGMARELLTSADTYAVQIAPAAADDPRLKKLIVGATVAITALMPSKKGGGGSSGGSDEGGSEE